MKISRSARGDCDHSRQLACSQSEAGDRYHGNIRRRPRETVADSEQPALIVAEIPGGAEANLALGTGWGARTRGRDRNAPDGWMAGAASYDQRCGQEDRDKNPQFHHQGLERENQVEVAVSRKEEVRLGKYQADLLIPAFWLLLLLTSSQSHCLFYCPSGHCASATSDQRAHAISEIGDLFD